MRDHLRNEVKAMDAAEKWPFAHVARYPRLPSGLPATVVEHAVGQEAFVPIKDLALYKHILSRASSRKTHRSLREGEPLALPAGSTTLALPAGSSRSPGHPTAAAPDMRMMMGMMAAALQNWMQPGGGGGGGGFEPLRGFRDNRPPAPRRRQQLALPGPSVAEDEQEEAEEEEAEEEEDEEEEKE